MVAELFLIQLPFLRYIGYIYLNPDSKIMTLLRALILEGSEHYLVGCWIKVRTKSRAVIPINTRELKCQVFHIIDDADGA